MKKKDLKILIFLPTFVKTNRDILFGILDYMESHQQREIEIIGIGEDYEKKAQNDFRGFDGAICYADGSKLSMNILSCAMPMIVVFPDEPQSELLANGTRSLIVCNSRPIGRAGARYLKGKNAASYVFVEDVSPTHWSAVRSAAFRDELKKHGKDAVVLNPDTLDQLDALPRPIAIMAENDRMAHRVLVYCRGARLDVPHDAMILGVDNDDILCRTAHPALSSIRMNGSEIGEKTAALLEDMMRHGPRAARELNYSFAGFAERMSTASEIVGGELVESVRAIIKSRLNSPGTSSIKVPEIVNQMGVSRRTLELEFRAKAGHTLHDEIVRQQLLKADCLLNEGGLSIEQIAAECRFSSPSHFGMVFRKQFGHTPSEARKNLPAG